MLPCRELQPTLDFFVERFGFRIDRISPADDPRAAEISGHGLRILLRRGSGQPGMLRLSCDYRDALGSAGDLVAPNGTRIELSPPTPELIVPSGRMELVVSRAGEDAAWVTGRAGMRYRDLIPGRLGGRFIASHIRIPDGGPVPDQVHFHAIRFQLIYCARGWVRVVYEDQGAPFVLEAGDAVLQPPGIRHRVLESSPGLEVIELACPAEHDTFFDHELELPTANVRSEREFGGQRFVRHVASEATWLPWRVPGFECRDTGIAEATAGLAGVGIVRASNAVPPTRALTHDGELLFFHLLAGEMTLEGATTEPLALRPDDSLVVPPGVDCWISAGKQRVEFLEVHLPGAS